MTRRANLLLAAAGAFVLAVAACGPGVVVTTAGPGELRGALAAAPEELEVTSDADRALLYQELLALAADEAVRGEPDAPVLFPIASGSRIAPAPFRRALDLLDPPAGAPAVDLDASPERWSDEAQAGLGGASERALAERVAQSLLAHWGAPGPVAVVRTAAVPFAAAFVDGKLRLNPAVVYLAAAGLSASSVSAVTSAEGDARTARAVPAAPDGVAATRMGPAAATAALPADADDRPIPAPDALALGGGVSSAVAVSAVLVGTTVLRRSR